MRHPLDPDPDRQNWSWGADYFQMFWEAICCKSGTKVYAELPLSAEALAILRQAGPECGRAFGRALEKLNAYDISIRDIRNAADWVWTQAREELPRVNLDREDEATRNPVRNLLKGLHHPTRDEFIRAIVEAHY
jgi:hypothetical protein